MNLALVNSMSPNDAADFWRYQVGLNIIPADTKEKATWIKWLPYQYQPIPEAQHENWKNDNLFENGMAIIAGKIWHNPNLKDMYLICIDLDNQKAIEEFRTIKGKRHTLEELADNFHFIVEQHADKTRAHVYFYSKKPYKKLNSISTSNLDVPKFEVKGEGGHGIMFVTPSPHKDGSNYQILGNESKFVEEPQTYDHIDKHIDSILSKYGVTYLLESDTAVRSDSFFRLNDGYDGKIKVGSRHNFLIRHCNSLIRQLHNTVTIESIKNLIEHINQTYFEEPLPNEELERIFNDCVTFMTKQINEEKSQTDISMFPQITNNVHYEISRNPPKYIIADKETKQLLEVTVKSAKDEMYKKYLFQNATYLACIPVEIIRHKNPLVFLNTIQKYTITFVDKVNEKHTFRYKTLAEIMQSLKELGYVLNDGSDKALNALLRAYAEKNIIKDTDETDYTGFLPDKENGAILASNIDIEEPSQKELSEAINFLAELKSFYNNRLDLLATSIIWGIVAPLMFVLKHNNHYLKLLHFYGSPNTTKSNTGKIILALDGHQEDQKYLLNLSRFDSIARAGQALSHSTFPILVDETNLTDPKMHWLVELLKSIVESQVSRSKFPSSTASSTIDIPALCIPILTGNPPPPLHESAYMKRAITRYFSQSEIINDRDTKAKQFREFMRLNLSRLNALGIYRNWWIMTNQSEILDEKKSVPPLDLGLKILKAAFDYVNMKIPQWLLEERLPEDELQESMEDNHIIVKRSFEKYIDQQLNAAIPIWRSKLVGEDKINIPNDISDRLIQLAKSNILPDIKYTRNFEVIIRKGILEELYSYGVTAKQLPNLKALADYMRTSYRKSNGKAVVAASVAKLTAYFDEVGDEENSGEFGESGEFLKTPDERNKNR